MKKRSELRSQVNDCSQIVKDLFTLRNLIEDENLDNKKAASAILGLISIYNKRFSSLNEVVKKVENGH
jgi:hypothetical protein